MAQLSARDQKIKRRYLEGTDRQFAMSEAGITIPNTMSSISNRLGLYWKWPLENRKSGIAPPKAAPKAPTSRKRTRPGKPKVEKHTRISPQSMLFNAPQKKSPSRTLQEFFDSVVVAPVTSDASPEELAPHLYRAQPYRPEKEKV